MKWQIVFGRISNLLHLVLNYETMITHFGIHIKNKTYYFQEIRISMKLIVSKLYLRILI